MISRMLHRCAGVVGVGAIVTVAGLTAMASAPSSVAAQSAGACTVSGSASILPGLGAVPTAQSYSFTGTTGTCVGNPGGAFAGGGTCPAGNLATCVPDATFNVTSSPFGTCSGGVLVQQGGLVEYECTTTLGPLVGFAEFTPNPPVQNPVTSVTFTGVAMGATP